MKASLSQKIKKANMRTFMAQASKGLGIHFIWEGIREQQIFKDHKKVASYFEPLLQQYAENKIKPHSIRPKKKLPKGKVLWQYWGQGIDSEALPEVVQLCFQSVDKYKEDYQVIRLSDDTIREYIDFPDFVWEKKEKGKLGYTFFSDLLRLALLAGYGGVWLDATVLLTDPLPTPFREWEYFVYQRDPNALFKRQWKSSYAYYWNWHPKFKVNVLNSIFFAQKGSIVVSAMLDLLLHYWETQEETRNYFLFQILYEELMKGELGAHQCPIIDDTLPHWLQTKVNGGLSEVPLEEVFRKQTVHKLSYFTEEGMEKLRKYTEAYL